MINQDAVFTTAPWLPFSGGQTARVRKIWWASALRGHTKHDLAV
jgi:hypothetical protein